MFVQFRLLRQPVDVFNADAVGCLDRAGPDTTQPLDVAVAAQGFTQIAGDRTDIAAFAADHFQKNMIIVGPVEHDQRLNEQRTRRDFHILAVAGQFIGALAVDLHGRELGRHLHDVTDESVQVLFNLIV